MKRNRPANGSDAKRRKQAEDTTGSEQGARTGHRTRRNALRFSALRLLLGDPEGWRTRFRLLCYNKVVH
jgi:hypothetical protein